ncbi:putative mitochondrial protein, partial [Mucuna pruriens]
MQDDFQKCSSEQTLFIKRSVGENILIVSIYVDDLIYTGNDMSMMIKFKKSMMQAFDMTDLGKMRFFLGIEVLQKPGGIFVCQQKYANDVLKKFAMSESKHVKSLIVPGRKISRDVDCVIVDDTYFKQIVGSLMYLTATRPDIMFNVSLISRYMSKPTELHLQAAKRILRYLKGTTSYEIFYRKEGEENLHAFTDSDYAGDEDDSKRAVSWMSKKQPIVTLSSIEAEFVAAAASACQAMWMRRVLRNLTHTQDSSTVIIDLVKDGEIELVHCGTQEQVADLMTKALKLEAFHKLRKKMRMLDLAEVN